MIRAWLICLLFIGCAQEKIENFDTLQPDLLEIVNSQAQRTSHFEQLVGGGVIEFSWKDDHGSHRQQGDFDFWRSGNSVSLRISKLGELLVWTGSTEEGSWLFDFTSDQSTLTLNDDELFFADAIASLALIGLAQLPAGQQLLLDAQTVQTIDEAGRTWTHTQDVQTGLPSAIRFTDGTKSLSASLRNPMTVEEANLHELHWQKTPSLIDITSSINNEDVKIAFAFLSTIVEEEPFDKVFNVDVLREALSPSSILGES